MSKSQIVTFRINPYAKERLQEMAKAQGLSVSDVIQQCVNKVFKGDLFVIPVMKEIVEIQGKTLERWKTLQRFFGKADMYSDLNSFTNQVIEQHYDSYGDDSERIYQDYKNEEEYENNYSYEQKLKRDYVLKILNARKDKDTPEVKAWIKEVEATKIG